MRKGHRGCLRIAALTILPCALITGVQPLPAGYCAIVSFAGSLLFGVAQALARLWSPEGAESKRSEVEEYFQLSGGLSGRTRAYYVYKECHLV